MRVHITTVDPGFEIEHPTGLPLLQHDVVQCFARILGVALPEQFCLQHRTLVFDVLSGEHFVDPVAHVGRADIGKKAQAAAIDAEYRHLVRRCESRRMQQRPVAADRDDEVGQRAELRFGLTFDAEPREIDHARSVDQHGALPRLQVARERQHRFADPLIPTVADEGNFLEFACGHLTWVLARERVDCALQSRCPGSA